MYIINSIKHYLFQVVGEPFKRHGQLMSVHAFVERNGQSKQLPLEFCLMSRRTKDDYSIVSINIQQQLYQNHPD